jgi:hypothetical protein
VLVLFAPGSIQFSNGKQVHQTFCLPVISTFPTTLLLLASYFESPNGDASPCRIPRHASFWRLSRPHPWRLWNILWFLPAPPPPQLNDDISSVAWDVFVSMAVDRKLNVFSSSDSSTLPSSAFLFRRCSISAASELHLTCSS